MAAAMYRYTMNYWLWVVFYTSGHSSEVSRERPTPPIQNATERFNPAANANTTRVKELDVEPEGPDFLFRSKQRRHRTTIG